MVAPIGLDAVDGNGGVEGERETENLEEESKGDVRTSFEKAAEAEQHEIGEDKRHHRGNGALGIDERLNHRRVILTVNSLCNKQSGSQPTAYRKDGRVWYPRFVSRRDHVGRNLDLQSVLSRAAPYGPRCRVSTSCVSKVY